MVEIDHPRASLITFGYLVAGLMLIGVGYGALEEVSPEPLGGGTALLPVLVYLGIIAYMRNSGGAVLLAVYAVYGTFTNEVGIHLDASIILSGVVLVSAAFWESYYGFHNINWKPSEIVYEDGQGRKIIYQESEDGEERWAVIYESGLFIDSEGDIREQEVFHDTEEEAVAAYEKYADPLNKPEIKESMGDRTVRHSKRVLKYGGLFIIAAVVGVLVIGGLGYATTPEPRVVDVSESGDEYTATVHNSGGGGDIEVRLYWSEHHPEEIDTIPDNPSEHGIELHRAESFYFSSGERRSVSYTGELPDWSESYHFEVEVAE